MSAVEKLDRFAERITLPKNIDWKQYELPQEEAAKLRHAENYREQVRQAFLGADEVLGLTLPWKHTDEFRFRDGEMTIWTGYNGHKKSMMLGQVVLGFIAQGATACIASLEMKPVKSLKRMARQFVGVDEPTIPALNDMFDWLADRLWFYDQVGTVQPKRMIAVARYALTELGIRHVVIDSLMKCSIDEDDYNRQKWFVDELQTLAQDTNGHVHLVAHQRKPHDGKEYDPGDKYSVAGSGNITNLPDNALVVYWNKKKQEAAASQKEVDENDPDALLICRKQREGEKEPAFRLYFNDKCLQFKRHHGSRKLDPDDWKECNWR